LVQTQTDAYSQSNSQLYTDAQHYCEKLNSTDFSGHNRVPCIEQYILDHAPASVKTIPDALYKYDFISPSWSPDLAGWTMVTAIASGSLFVITFIARRWLKSSLA
jgi:hypothetical protein